MSRGTRERKAYLSVMRGKIVEKVDEGTKDAISRVNAKGNTVWETEDTYIESFITGVEVTTHDDFGKSLELNLDDGEEQCVLKMFLSSGSGNSFLNKMVNIDFKKEVSIEPWEMEQDGKKKSGLVFKQMGLKVLNAYTREEPNGCPELEKVTFKGEERWDDTKKMAWLLDILETSVIPDIARAAGHVPMGGSKPAVSPDLAQEATKAAVDGPTTSQEIKENTAEALRDMAADAKANTVQPAPAEAEDPESDGLPF